MMRGEKDLPSALEKLFSIPEMDSPPWLLDAALPEPPPDPDPAPPPKSEVLVAFVVVVLAFP